MGNMKSLTEQRFEIKNLVIFEFLFLFLFTCIIFLSGGADFLRNLPSSRFTDSNNKIIYNYGMILFWIFCNHAFIFILRNHEFLTFRFLRFCLHVILIGSFVLAFIELDNLRKVIDKVYYLFGIGHLHPVFIDLRGFLAGVNKAQNVGDPFSVNCEVIDEPCIGWGWSYGSTILKLRDFKIFEERFTHFIALAFFILFFTVLLKISEDTLTRTIVLILSATGVSLIIIERMNIDILVVIILFAILKSRSGVAKVIFFSLLVLFSLTKYYTFFLIPIIIFLEKSWRIRFLYFFLTVISIPTAVNDIKNAGSGSLNFGYAATFGIKNLIGSISGSVNPVVFSSPIKSFIVFVLLLILIFYFYFVYKNECHDFNFNLNTFELKLFILCSVNLIFAWTVASNYPYRLVSIFGVLPFIVRYLRRNENLLVLQVSLCFIAMNSLPISLTILRNMLFAIFMSSLIALNLVITKNFYDQRLRKSAL
jgi:hypothetical protein